MGWDAILFADLTFPPGGIEAWRELGIESDTYEDWSDAPLMIGEAESTTVTGVLAKLAKHSTWCAEVYGGPDHQTLVVTANHVSFRAYINEDDYGAYSTEIATLFRLGERVKATGEYVVLANDSMAGDRIVLARGKSRLEAVDFVEMLSGGEPPEGALDYQGILDKILEVTQKRVDAMVKAQGKKTKAAPTREKGKPAGPAKKAGAKVASGSKPKRVRDALAGAAAPSADTPTRSKKRTP